MAKKKRPKKAKKEKWFIQRHKPIIGAKKKLNGLFLIFFLFFGLALFKKIFFFQAFCPRTTKMLFLQEARARHAAE